MSSQRIAAAILFLSLVSGITHAKPSVPAVALKPEKAAIDSVDRSAVESAERTPEKPGEKEFLGCNKYPESKKFRWGVRGEVGVSELVASLGEISCQTIIVGPQVATRAGKVTLEVPDLLTASEVYRLFHSALEVLGLTVERSGKALKIVDASRGKEVSQPLAAGQSTPESDRFVTRLLRLQHARPQDIADVLAKLKSKEGDVAVFAPSQSLIVTDRGTNVRRMEDLVSVLDVPRAQSTDRLWLLATHQQSATELSATVEKILQASRRTNADGPLDPKAPASATSGPLADGITALVAVDAARALIVVGSEAGYQRVRTLAARIDPLAADDTAGQAHVVYLANTNADEMSTTLRDLGLGSRSGASASPRPAGLPGATNPAQQSAIPLQGDVRIAADKVSNAIVVFAGGSDFQMVRDLISKLDVPRRQVYVEATIFDVSIDKSRSIGLSFHGGKDVGGGATALVSSQSSDVNTLAVNATQLGTLASGAGLLAGILGPSMTVAGMSLPSIGVILKAVETAANVNVISRPHLLTMDNVKAELAVGRTFPVQTGSSSVAGANLLSTYGRQEVLLKMDLTPHLNESESVRLEIDGEISDVPDGVSATSSPGGPITNKRVIKTSVVVRDGDAVVLGGLQKESESETIEKIPFLGDIPLLGRLFQTRSKSRTKQDLLIVLVPYVIRGPEDLQRIYAKKEAERIEFLERYTAFRDETVYDHHVDYKRKRGLLEEINVSSRNAESEARTLRSAERALKKPMVEGAIDQM